MRKKTGIVAFGIILCVMFSGCDQKSSDIKEKNINVEVSRLREMEFTHSYRIPGEVKPVNSAFVSPKIPGVIVDIFVEEGDCVIKDETELFKIDSENIEKTLKKAEQGLVLAGLAVEESRANLDKLQAEYDNALNNFKRHKALYEKNAVSESSYDKIFTDYKKSEAMLKHGKTLLALAEGNLTQAEIDLSIIRKNYDDTIVKAPINGLVTEKRMEKGETGAPGSPIIKIVDVDNLEISGFLPSAYFNRVELEKTQIEISYDETVLGTYTVTYKSPVIDPVTRNFEIRCKVSGDGRYVVPGNLVQMNIIFIKKQSFGIPDFAVIKRSGKDCVFIVSDNKAELTEVKTGIQNNGFIEINDANSLKEREIIIRGQLLLDNGNSITVRKGE